METKKYLKKLRIEKKLSARALSKIFNLEESAISEIERGKRNLTIEMLKKYCEYFHESADIILNLSNKIPNIIYENNEIILYNFKIEKPDDSNNCQYCSFKIKFKEKKWDNIYFKYNFEFNYYNNVLGIYIPAKKSKIIFSSLEGFEPNEDFDFTLLDCKQDENYNFFNYPIKNANFKIIKATNDKELI